MKFLIIAFILSFLFIKSKQELICWQGPDKLTVEDFQGLNSADSLSRVIGLNPKPAALSAIQYGVKLVDHDSINKYRFIGYFNRNLSWLDEEGKLLSHEQTHFNIQELILRKTNKDLDSIFQYSGQKINYDSLMNIIGNKIDVMSGTFDSQTLHGSVSVWNEKWVDEIKVELEKLNNFGVSCNPSCSH